MAIKINYVVVRNGVDKLTTQDKKEADKYDRMLDVAENLSDFIQCEGQDLDLDEVQIEQLGVILSKNKELVNKLFKGSSFSDVGSK